MAMFPLGSVLLPGGVLALHVFEPRYRDMVRACLACDGPVEFGQVLITRGREVGGGDDVGTGGAGVFGKVALGEHNDPLRFADPVGQHE